MIIKKNVISVSEAKEILEKMDLETADQIQKRALEYVTKFSKVSPQKAQELRQRLVSECGLTTEGATELINVMVETPEELRVFTAGWRKLLPSQTVEKVLAILKSA